MLGYNFAIVICSIFLLWSPSTAEDVQTVLVVSTEGHPEHFASVQGAVDAVPMWNYLRWVIYIKPGTYHGPVIVPEGKVCDLLHQKFFIDTILLSHHGQFCRITLRSWARARRRQ